MLISYLVPDDTFILLHFDSCCLKKKIQEEENAAEETSVKEPTHYADLDPKTMKVSVSNL